MFLIGTMLAISCQIKIAVFVAIRFGIRWEVNMKKIASIISAVAGTVLLGWSGGDMFPRLQGNAQIEKHLPVEDVGASTGGSIPPHPAKPCQFTKSDLNTRSGFVVC